MAQYEILSPTAYSLHECYRLLKKSDFLLLWCDWDSNVNEGKLFSFPVKSPLALVPNMPLSNGKKNRRRVKFILRLYCEG